MNDYFLIATRNLTHRRMRSFLTIVGIFIGIAAVVALMALGDGLQKAVTGEFEKLGTDKITIMPKSGAGMAGSMAGGLSLNPLTTDDLKVVQRVSGVKLAGGMMYTSGQVAFKGKTTTTFVMGLPMDETRRIFEDMQNIELSEGRKLRQEDKGGALLGFYAATDLFKRKVAVGDTVSINGKPFKVEGILASMGNRMDDSQVYVTMDALREMTGDEKRLDIILAQVDASAKPSEVAKKMEEKLRRHRGQKEGEEDFEVQTSEQLMQSFSAILGVVQAMIVGIAAISLLVGGIGIMNTMYTSVIERTRDIGVMKAIGASNGDIMTIFLIESGLLGLVGGAVGVIIGASLSKIAEIAAEAATGSALLKAAVTPELVGGALLFAFVIGAVSGTLPARQAASLKPVDALRYE